MKSGSPGLWHMLRTTKCELSGVSAPRANTQACGWWVGGVGKVCSPSCRWGQCCVLLGLRIWELNLERLEAVSLLLSLLPPGIYVCVKCGYELFSSHSKYAHSSPWPAFTETIHANSVAKRPEHNQPKALKVGDCSRERERGVGQPFLLFPSQL